VIVASGNYPPFPSKVAECADPGKPGQQGEALMLRTMVQSMLTPRYPRRYVGRHRARISIRMIFMVPAPRRAE